MATLTDMTAVAAATGTVDEQIGALVHQLMWQNRMTQRDMADRLGIQQSAMSRKLRGGRPWLAAEVATVAGALGVSPGELYPSVQPIEPLPSGPQASGGDTSTTRRNYTGDGDAVLVRPHFGASRFAVAAASAATADRDRVSA